MHTQTTHRSRNRKRQRGVGMIEVLATVVILAIGLLGIAALQLMSKKSNFESVQRTAAAKLASNILERMRANSTAVALEAYAGTVDAPKAEFIPKADLPEPAPNCSQGNPCPPLAAATYDLWEFQLGLAGADVTNADGDPTGGLVSPRACIRTTVPSAQVDNSGNPNRSGQYTITVVWRGQTKLSNPDTTAATPPGGTCGEGSGLYDDVPGDNAHRRRLQINTYIAQR